MGIVRWLLRLTGVGVGVLVVTIGLVTWSAAHLQDAHGPEAKQVLEADALIILGAGWQPQILMDVPTRMRVLAGAGLYKRGRFRRVILCGGAAMSRAIPIEGVRHLSQHMQDLAERRGIPADVFLRDDVSLSTLENLVEAFAMMDAAGLESFVIVTDDFHLMRALALSRFLGREPAGLGASRMLYYQHPFMQSAYIVREAGAWWYNLFRVISWTVLGQPGPTFVGAA